MISSAENFERTRQYVDRLQTILVSLRASHTPGDYQWMSKPYLKELIKAQRAISVYLATPEVAGEPLS